MSIPIQPEMNNHMLNRELILLQAKHTLAKLPTEKCHHEQSVVI
jgi:hypothetical protein